MSGRQWERFGAIFGILFFAAVVANFGTPETPDIDDPTAQIVTELADDRDGFVFGVYLLYLGSIFFLVFTGGLWSRLRRAEPEPGASVLTALAGLGSAVIVAVGASVLYAVVEAADRVAEAPLIAKEPDAVRALFELDEVMVIGIGVTTSAFYAGVALSALRTGSLPAWLGWIAALLAVAFPIGLLGTFSEEDEGGALGTVFFIALLVNFLWVLAASIVMLLGGRQAPAEAPAAPRPAA